MSSPDLGLPYIASQQAQPEVTHNTALLLLQALANGVISVGSNTPPGSPVDGDAHILGAAPTGAWAGRANAVTIYLGGWFFLPDRNTAGTIIPIGARHQGLSVYNRADATMYRWSGTAWQSITYATAADLAAHEAAANPHPVYATDADLTAHTGSTAAHDAANLTFTPSTVADWSGATDPGDILEALDQIQAKASSKTTVNATSDADITLTAAQANAAVIDITDTGTVLTAARNVIVPARPGAFDFVNSTARALTVKTPSGSGAAVPKGARFPLLVGSTNVRNPQMGAFIPFADFPPASGNSGLVLGASDVGPAPGIELISDGTIWRPRGGVQLLYAYDTPDITNRNLAATVMLTGPTVPANLLQIGLKLRVEISGGLGGIGTTDRRLETRLGAAQIQVVNSALSAAVRNFQAKGRLKIITSNGNQSIGIPLGSGYVTDTQQVVSTANINTTIANTLDWRGTSFAETAETITSASWAASVVTFGYAATPSAKAVGDVIVVSGMTPSAYNGTYSVTVVGDTTHWSAALASDPGAAVLMGTSQRTSNVVLRSVDVWLEG